MRPPELRAVYMQAATHLTYPEIKAHIHEKLSPEFHVLAMRLALIAVSSNIADLSSLEERRRVLDTYPDCDGALDGIRDEVKLGVQRLWRRRKSN